MGQITQHQTFTSLHTELAIHRHIDTGIANYSYDNLLFVQMLKGSKYIHLEGMPEVQLNTHQIMMSSVKIEADVYCREANPENPSVCATLEIDKSQVGKIMERLNEQYDISKISTQKNNFSDFSIYQINNSTEILHTIDKLKQLHTHENDFKDRFIHLAIEELVLRSLQSNLRSQLINNYSFHLSSHPLSFAIDFIKKNLKGKINIEVLAEKASMSRATFHRQFKIGFGMSPIAYIQAERIKLSKELLTKTDLSISNICYDLGYSSPSYFIKQFKETVGMSPNTFRKSRRK